MMSTCHTFNSIEFDGVKIRVMKLLPQANKLNRAAVAHPVLQNVIAALRIPESSNIRKAYKIIAIFGKLAPQ